MSRAKQPEPRESKPGQWGGSSGAAQGLGRWQTDAADHVLLLEDSMPTAGWVPTAEGGRMELPA